MSDEWQFATPEAEGMDASVLGELDAYLKQKRYRQVNSVLVVKNDKIVWENYYNRCHEHSRQPIKSIWKSILGILTGICLDKGIIGSLDEPVGAYLKEFAQKRHPYHKLLTIRHLLTLSSGLYWNGGIHYHAPMMKQMMRTADWVAHLADLEMMSIPGREFQYKEWDVLLLSALLGRAYGGTAYEVAKEFLYGPLEIASGVWPQSPCGVSYPVMAGEEESNLSARDLAKIGLLFLHEGRHNGDQIVSAEFVHQALQPSFTNISFSASDDLSYGFLWWLLPDGYGCRGFGGQEINVIPSEHFVSVIQATPTLSSQAYEDIQANLLRRAIK